MKATRLFFKRPWIIIAICVILTGVFGFFITGLGIDNSIRQFLPQKDASYTRLTQTEDEFGSMIVIGVSLESKKGSVLTPENIEVVRKITDRCLDLNEVEGVDSLTHIDYVWRQFGMKRINSIYEDLFIIGMSVFSIDKRISRTLSELKVLLNFSIYIKK